MSIDTALAPPLRRETMLRRFFEGLPRFGTIPATFDAASYAPAPADWFAIAADVENSTAEIEAGRQKSVNFVGASAIAALVNLCAPETIPFQFGGDGAVALIPPAFAEAARQALARTRGFARREYGLHLRVGMVPVRALTARGQSILVGRYEPANGNQFAVFLGDGLDYLETAIKGRSDPELAAEAVIDEALDDGEPPDLSGLSCRWAPLPARRGQMVALIVTGSFDQGMLYDTIARLAGDGSETSFGRITRHNLRLHWPPKNIHLEAGVRRSRGGLWRLPGAARLYVLLVSAFINLLILTGIRVGKFDPERYQDEIISNTDFYKRGMTLALVFDCPAAGLAQLRELLDAEERKGTLHYGIQVSDFALMTCFVTALDQGQHAHFIDGGDGGYTFAAKRLKALLSGGISV